MTKEARMIPAEQKKFLEDRNAGYVKDPRGGKGLAKLREKLLSIGGEEVCLQFEDDLKNLMKRGRVFPSTGAKMSKGEPCHCHTNCCALWDANKNQTQIVVGWGLSADGIWRQHTFCWQPASGHPRRGRVIETTQKRVIYFGFKLSRREAKEFCGANFWI